MLQQQVFTLNQPHAINDHRCCLAERCARRGGLRRIYEGNGMGSLQDYNDPRVDGLRLGYRF